MYGQVSKHSHDKCTREEGIYAPQEVLPAVQRKERAAAGTKDGGMAQPPRVLTASFTHLKGDADVMQRKPFTEEDIIDMAGKRGCPKEAVTKEVVKALLEIVNPIEKSYYIPTSFWNLFGSSEPHNIINTVLDMIKAQYDAGVGEPEDVINSVLAMMQAQIGKGGDDNIKGSKDVAGMFSDKELFDISKGKKEFTSLAAIMKVLDGKQRGDVLGCMLELQACCTVDGVGKVVEGALVNVNKSLLDKGAQNGEDENIYTESFVRRMIMMTEFVKGAYKEIESRHKGKYEIEPTGSDPHEGGKHALFLVDKKTGEKRVYKPRSMAVDNALTGERGMLALINGNEKNTNYTLPVMEIDPKDNTEEFVDKKRSFTEEEAGRYYFKMGMLECAGSVMGVTDLHQDNIMPTADGPVIIDAECAFAYFGGTGLGDALTGSNVAIGLRQPVAMFNIQPEKQGDRPVKSTQAFNQGGDKNKYRKQYKEGFNFMLEKLTKRFKEKDFVEGMGGVLAGVDRVRVVPVSTKDFADMMHTYIGADLKIRQLVIEDLCKEVCDDLDNGEYAFNTGDKGGGMVIDKKLLAGGIKAAFDARTIPAVELDVNGGILYMDGVAIGKSPLGGDMKKAIMHRMLKKLRELKEL